MHVDQPGASGMEKQIDRLRLSHTAITGERQRIGAVQADLVTTANQRFELGDYARAPSAGLLDLRHLAFEKTLVNGCHRSAPDDGNLSASPGPREPSDAARPIALQGFSIHPCRLWVKVRRTQPEQIYSAMPRWMDLNMVRPRRR